MTGIDSLLTLKNKGKPGSRHVPSLTRKNSRNLIENMNEAFPVQVGALFLKCESENFIDRPPSIHKQDVPRELLLTFS